MQKYAKAYLYHENKVVLDKKDIKNAKDEEFREITLLVSSEQIKDWYQELYFTSDLEDEDDEDDFLE